MMQTNDLRRRDYFTLKFINPVIRILTFSDLIIIGSYGLIAPIFAVFIIDSIEYGTLAVVGIAQAAYLLAKSIFQIPTALIIDAKKGEKDDFWAMFIGSIVFSIIPLFYLVVKTPPQLYILQFIYGGAMAVAQPAYNAIWVRHLDKGHEALESGVYNTLVGLGGAVTASIGGFIALEFGFQWLFILVSIASLLGTLLILPVYRNMKTGNILFN